MNDREFFPLSAVGGDGGGAPAGAAPSAGAPDAAGPGGSAAAPSAAGSDAAPGAAGAGTGSLLARGAGSAASAGSPAAAADGAADEPPAVPEKYVVKKEDGTIDYEATALKQAAGYQALAKRMGAGDAPPAKPEDYAPTLPEGLTLDALKADPLYQGFLKGAHARGMTNAHVSYVLDALAQRMRPDPVVAEAELRKVWPTDAELDKNLAGAFRVVKTYAGGDAQMAKLEAKFGSDPDFLQFMARIAPELGEDKALQPDFTDNDADTLESVMTHPGYLDGKHPEHAKLVAKARGLYAKKYPEKA
jgi:hypothetical protein